MLNSNNKKILLNIAKTTVETYIKDNKVLDFKIDDEELNNRQGVFVTLHINGDLRGCIGQIMPGQTPLWKVVRDMAIAAATEDPRFSPVSVDELGKLDYEISVLSVPKRINNWRDIELGRHGVILSKGYRTGVFLPQVATETGWTLEEFLSNLCEHKAGLPADAYKNDPEVEIKVFEAEVF